MRIKGLKFGYILLVVTGILLLGIHFHPKDVLAQNVDLDAKIELQITLKIYPEKRIPRQGNWDNLNQIEIRDPDTQQLVYSASLESNTQGEVTLPKLNAELFPKAEYQIWVKGRSHLRKNFGLKNFNANTLYLDLSNQELLAGDTAPDANNIINSLDFNYSAQKIYTDDLRADLNQDGVVNSHDFSNMVKNNNLVGD